MNAGIENKELNTGALAPEGVMDGTPEITEDNLFELVDSGAISLEQANEWIKAQEEIAGGTDDSGSDDNPSSSASQLPLYKGSSGGNNKEDVSVPENINNEPDVGGVVSGEGKPFKVYQTQEEFQRDFDRSWNKRYGKEMSEREAKDAELDEILTSLGALLGVPKENAKEEYEQIE